MFFNEKTTKLNSHFQNVCYSYLFGGPVNSDMGDWKKRSHENINNEKVLEARYCPVRDLA